MIIKKIALLLCISLGSTVYTMQLFNDAVDCFKQPTELNTFLFKLYDNIKVAIQDAQTLGYNPTQVEGLHRSLIALQTDIIIFYDRYRAEYRALMIKKSNQSYSEMECAALFFDALQKNNQLKDILNSVPVRSLYALSLTAFETVLSTLQSPATEAQPIASSSVEISSSAQASPAQEDRDKPVTPQTRQKRNRINHDLESSDEDIMPTRIIPKGQRAAANLKYAKTSQMETSIAMSNSNSNGTGNQMHVHVVARSSDSTGNTVRADISSNSNSNNMSLTVSASLANTVHLNKIKDSIFSKKAISTEYPSIAAQTLYLKEMEQAFTADELKILGEILDLKKTRLTKVLYGSGRHQYSVFPSKQIMSGSAYAGLVFALPQLTAHEKQELFAAYALTESGNVADYKRIKDFVSMLKKRYQKKSQLSTFTSDSVLASDEFYKSADEGHDSDGYTTEADSRDFGAAS